MMRRWIWILCISFIGSSTFAEPEKGKEFRVPKTTIDALERKFDSEKNPKTRIQLLLRWIKAKDDYEQAQLEKQAGDEVSPAQLEAFKQYKASIIDRILAEIAAAERQPDLDKDPLYRVLAFRLLEAQRFGDSLAWFQRIQKQNADDSMGMGDALFKLGDSRKALEYYERGGRDLKYRNMAGYKRAWALMQLNDFSSAIKEFDVAMEENPFNTLKLKEEAYKDRVRAYVETFSKPHFDDEEIQKWKALAVKVYPQNSNKAKELLIAGFKALIQAFNAKGSVDNAQKVYGYLTKEVQDTMAVLVIAAPLWIKVHRGRLNHDQVLVLLDSLPDSTSKLKDLDLNPLQTELYNSVVFYDSLFKEDGRPETRKILVKVNRKYFHLFPEDANADNLRLGYAKLLLEDGDPEECLVILSKHKAEQDDLVASLEAKCQLKQLDLLYTKPHDEFFYNRLKAALIDKKVYERSDLGLSSELAFEGLVRMLVGAIEKNKSSTYLKTELAELMAKYPYSNDTKLYSDLQVLQAELRFEDLVESKSNAETKSDEFFAVFSGAPKDSSVAKKALLNSIKLGRSLNTLDRCETYASTYTSEFKPGDELFERCIRLAELYSDLEKEYGFWVRVENNLSDVQKVKVGLIELALGRSNSGKKRLEKVKTDSAKAALELWEPAASDASNEAKSQAFEKLESRIQDFEKTLKPIKFNQIGKVFPTKTKDFEVLDAQLVRFFKGKQSSADLARSLELRAELAEKMKNWIQALPEPPGLSSEDLQTYRTKSSSILASWVDGAEKRKKECGEVAHTLAMEFKVKNPDLCPNLAAESAYAKYLDKWEKTRQKSTTGSDTTVLESGMTPSVVMANADKLKEKEPLKAKYYYIRALDLAKTDYDRARAYLSLAKLENRAAYWEAASSLDGNLVEPIKWWRKKASGNPFFEKLYDRMIAIVE